MKQIGRIMMLCVLSVSLTGCGTIVSRCQAPHFGAYPYEGVLIDCVAPAGLLTGSRLSTSDRLGFSAAFIASLPFDAVLDTLLLPPDLIFWIAGKHKEASYGPSIR
jgi:uncharacterized protein YceK